MLFNRQKVLIEFIRQSTDGIDALRLVKYAFILSKDYESRGGESFYKFVPYKQGPFSFLIYQELNKLEISRLIERNENRFTLSTNGSKLKYALGEGILADIKHLVKVFSHYSRDALIDHVYNNNKYYTYNSNIKRLAVRPCADIAIYTAGYEGQLIDEFIDMLLSNGIRQVIDIRNNPIARRYGFHKSTLHRICTKVDLDYHHLPELGIRSESRKELNTPADYESLFEDYLKNILTNREDDLKNAASLIHKYPTVMVCQEKCHHMCHRHVLADIIKEMTHLDIIELRDI